jgi:hypothetical protein
VVANTNGELPLQILIGKRPCEAHSTYTYAAGGMVLIISTVLAERYLAVELISTYSGNPRAGTIATHLLLGPVGHAPVLHSSEHSPEHLDPIQRARECAYDHAHELVDLLRSIGHEARVLLDERSFEQLERIE